MAVSNPQLVLIGPTAERHRGGIAQFTTRLADELAKEIPTKFFSWYELYPRFLIQRELAAQANGIAQTETRFSLGFLSYNSWIKTADAIAELGPQRIFFTWSHFVHAPIYLRLIQRLRQRTSAELVCICHNVLPHERLPGAQTLTARCLKNFDLVIVHSKHDSERLKRLVPGIRVDTLFLPLFDFLPASSATLRQAPPGENQKLLFFGSIRGYKGLDTLLRAMPLIRERRPSATLHIAGEPFANSRSRLTALLSSAEPNPLSLIERFNLQDCVTTDLRYIPDAEVAELFQAAAIAVFPFRFTNQSATVNLALAHGVPVVASNVGGIAEYVHEGENGLLVPPNDERALANSILKLMDLPISRERVAASTSHLSWGGYVERLLRRTSAPRAALNSCAAEDIQPVV